MLTRVDQKVLSKIGPATRSFKPVEQIEKIKSTISWVAVMAILGDFIQETYLQFADDIYIYVYVNSISEIYNRTLSYFV